MTGRQGIERRDLTLPSSAAQLFEWWPRSTASRPRRCGNCRQLQRRIHGEGRR
jgi:hypothetical protein